MFEYFKRLCMKGLTIFIYSCISQFLNRFNRSLRLKCPNKEFFLVHISRIQTEYSVSLRIQSECGKILTRKKLRIWTLFKQWILSEYKQLNRWTLILICVICPHLFFPQNFTIRCRNSHRGCSIKKTNGLCIWYCRNKI